MKKALFLYTKISEYFLAAIEELSKQKIEIHIVRFPVSKTAPFFFRKIKNVTIYDRSDFSKKQLIKLADKINPNIIIVSGWTDKTYLKIAHTFFLKKIPTVLFFDNRWQGTLKQQIAQFVAPFYFKNKFSSVWIPGKTQLLYAKKLGFSENKIYFNGLTADTKLFSSFYEDFKIEKTNNFPKKFLFVGRYIEDKGLSLLWEAFTELQKEEPSEWTLVCTGNGKLFNKKVIHPQIKHCGFVQPKDMGPIIKETGIFILPSNFEPWGVVVHEFATAGYPLILSDKVGAGAALLKPNKNGFIFSAGDKESLKTALRKTINSSPSSLIQMSKNSRELSSVFSPKIWADTILKMIESKKNI